MGKWSKRLVIPSRLEDACHIEHQIIDHIAEDGFNENACFAVRLALDEALSNAIRHGNRNDPGKQVTVDVDVDDEKVVISVCDQGPGFKVDQVPDPTAEENLERPSGRGVMLMKAYMTEVHYNDQGNCLHMVKRRDCPLPQIPES